VRPSRTLIYAYLPGWLGTYINRNSFRHPLSETSLLAEKFLLYVGIGACAFIIDYDIFLGCFVGTRNPYIANFFGICSGMSVSFSLNRKYNFRKTDVPRERAIKFIVIAILGMILSSVLIMILIAQGMDARFAKMIAMGVVFIAQFGANACWTFR
jgi:putative flippase GtrA